MVCTHDRLLAPLNSERRITESHAAPVKLIQFDLKRGLQEPQL